MADLSPRDHCPCCSSLSNNSSRAHEVYWSCLPSGVGFGGIPLSTWSVGLYKHLTNLQTPWCRMFLAKTMMIIWLRQRQLLWKLEVQHPVRRSPPLGLVFRQLNLVHNFTFHFSKTQFNIFFILNPNSPRWSRLLMFSDPNCTCVLLQVTAVSTLLIWSH